jgi:hypothetical protein
MFIDERHQRDGHLQQFSDDARHPVEDFFARSVEQVEASQQLEPLRFIGGQRRRMPFVYGLQGRSRFFSVTQTATSRYARH